MAELEATVANNARIAQAMEWRIEREQSNGIDGFRIHEPGGRDRGWWRTRAVCDPLPAYFTDEALVVPMMERLWELTSQEAVLIRHTYLAGWTCKAGWRSGQTQGTPNLAVAAALLRVWEEAQRERA